jgi:deazaflavin-dependent oxidoreductase (nitroreductase family)
MAHRTNSWQSGRSTEKTMPQREIPDWIKNHLREYTESPATAHFWDATFAGGKPATPCLLLTTTGRKSGKQLTMPLIYGKDGNRHVIVASKGGAPDHPAWYLNLQAKPEVELQVAEKTFRAKARTAAGEERKRLWTMMSQIYPPYPDYQKKTQREIPVVILETIS